MATTKSPVGAERMPALRGTLIAYVRNGRLIVAKWPRRRGPSKNETAKRTTTWFKEANLLAKYVATEDQKLAYDATVGSPLLPRDIILMAMAGRHFAIDLDNGKTIWPVAMTKAVSDSLDSISQIPGTLLVRAPDGWIALAPGEANTVLTSQGPTEPPHWTPGVAGGGDADLPTLADFPNRSIHPEHIQDVSARGMIRLTSPQATAGAPETTMYAPMPAPPFRVSLGLNLDLSLSGFAGVGLVLKNAEETEVLTHRILYHQSENIIMWLHNHMTADFGTLFSSTRTYPRFTGRTYIEATIANNQVEIRADTTSPARMTWATWSLGSTIGNVAHAGLHLTGSTSAVEPLAAEISHFSITQL